MILHQDKPAFVPVVVTLQTQKELDAFMAHLKLHAAHKDVLLRNLPTGEQSIQFDLP